MQEREERNSMLFSRFKCRGYLMIGRFLPAGSGEFRKSCPGKAGVSYSVLPWLHLEASSPAAGYVQLQAL